MTPNDLTDAVARAAPPVAYMGVRMVGVSLPDWVAIATLLYILLQIAHLVWRWWRAAHRGGTGV